MQAKRVEKTRPVHSAIVCQNAGEHDRHWGERSWRVWLTRCSLRGTMVEKTTGFALNGERL